MPPRLLICDDDSHLRSLLSAVLSRSYEVAEAPDGPRALALAKRLKPDVLVLDMNLPGMSGLEIQRTLRRSQPTLPVIVLTGERELESAQEALELGAVQYLTKPVDPEVLEGELAKVLRERRGPPARPRRRSRGSRTRPGKRPPAA